MPEEPLPVERYIELLRNARLSPRTRNMLEYILYQLNMAMLKEGRLNPEPDAFPCGSTEIEELNVLMCAAGSGEIDADTAESEIMARLDGIVERINSAGESAVIMSRPL